ncbi:BTB/POZ domain-containing protein [Plectosphaerella plurivora]|uniref:BTB/POZ domain-containing protein n=1 Tax=Plectosphaerella plurivora TaxID=936078 RepID=A0A9P8VFB6_9PEZI|nr:BTB/POZ domain-containing protein [Plectosphaerella plurivora]
MSAPESFDLPRASKNGGDGDSLSEVAKIPTILPHERVFPIQIGSELFKLSGASISSDAPSYFSQYFCCQVQNAHERGEDLSTAIRTLYIDRDPGTFHDISLHLQGYHITPRDGTHFVRLFADAQFYSLPRLISQLFDESIFISIGHREFQIPRDIFTIEPGNTPNFFSLGYAIFFSNPEDLFPGLDRDGLIRPPSIQPPCVPHRSADLFADLLHLLRGYPVDIRDETHRQALLRDCRYFNFKGLEQKLIPHHLSYNQARARDEIVLRVEDILKSGISVSLDPRPNASTTSSPAPTLGSSAPPPDAPSGWVAYARPFVDDHPADLILEIGGESTRLLHPAGPSPRAEFFRTARARVARLLEVVATKLNLPPTTQPLGLLMAAGGAGSQPPTPGHTPLSDDLVRVIIGRDAHIVLDGKTWTPPASDETADEGDAFDGSRKRRRVDTPGAGDTPDEWIVRSGQWRLRIRGSRGGKSAVECVLVAVRLDAYSCESARNASRGFLGAP